MKLSSSVATILSPAYGPCPEFAQACGQMRWDPNAGHVPRGFFGASGELSEVELILVVAEPGDPHHGECHSGLESAYDYSTNAFRTRKDRFHSNVMKILDMCWPDIAFEQQTRKVWLTESVLCSARIEGGHVSSSSSRACGRRYLLSQLALFPGALVVALGSKARDRLRALGVTDFISAYAVAPPGCNMPDALESWKQVPIEIGRRRGGAA